MAKQTVKELYKKDLTKTPLIGEIILPSAWSVMQAEGGVLINGKDIKDGIVPVLENGVISQESLDVSDRGWSQTCTFSKASATQVNWTSGVFTSADGTTYSISAGNTGTMSAKTYIYLDIAVSVTVYQKTTTPTTAVGVGKVLIAVAENAASSATFALTETTQIVGDNILVNTIAASKITTGQLVVGTNVGLGTAQDSGGVTTIIGNTVTTSYINAKAITVLGAVTAGSITGLTVRTNNATYPHAVMNSSGLTIHGQYCTFKNTSGTAYGHIEADASDGLLISSYSGINTYINGANYLNLNAGGSYLYLKQGDSAKIRISSSIINCYVALSSTSSCNFAGMTCNGNLAPNSSNSRHCGTSGAYWARVYSDAYFTKNTTFQTFDKYDDLQILRDLKFDKNEKLIIDKLPKEIADGDFINFGGMTSFNMCASKKIVECVDDLKDKLDEAKRTIEDMTERLISSELRTNEIENLLAI